MPPALLVIVNPTAGAGRAGRLVSWIGERLRPRGDAELHLTTGPGDGEEAARDGVARGAARVVAVGGDGTVQEVVNGVMASGGAASVGVVPVGTGNDLARGLGLPADPAEAWTAALGSPTRVVDLALAENGSGRRRWLVSAGGIGFDAQVAAAMAGRRGLGAGRAGYLVTTLRELRRFENRCVRVSADEAVLERASLFVAVANGPYYGGGMRIAPDARMDDGVLDICVVGDISRLTALRQLPGLYRGTHVRHRAVTMLKARNVNLTTDRPTAIHLDGEPFGEAPLRLRVAASLEVAVPERRTARRTDPAGR